MSMFTELKSRVKDWNIDDEDSLIRKMKQFSENYISKTNELSSNLNGLERSVQKVEASYHNSLNMLKNMSIKKFVEHSISNETIEVKKKSISNPINSSLVSKEEKESALYLKFKNAISISLNSLNIKDIIDLKDNKDAIDDDVVSVTSTKNFSNMNNVFSQSGIKLPTIIGQDSFFKSPTLGINIDNNAPQNAPSNPNPIPQTIQITVPISPKLSASYTIPNNPNSNVPIYIDIPKNPNDIPPQIPQIDKYGRVIDDDNKSVKSNRSTNSTRNIAGRASVVVSSKDPTKIIFNNDAAKGNIPKVPNIPIPIPRRSIKKKPEAEIKVQNPKPFEPQAPKLTQKDELMARFNKKEIIKQGNNNPEPEVQSQVKPQIQPKVETQIVQDPQPSKKFENSQTINIQKPPPSVLINSNKFKNSNQDDDEDGGKLFANANPPLKNAFTQQFGQPVNQQQEKNKNKSSLFNLDDDEEPIILKKPNNQPPSVNNNADPIALTNFLNRKDTVMPPKQGLNNDTKEDVKQSEGLRKARTKILSMFENDDDDNDTVSVRTNEKSKSIYNRLNNILDDKKNASIQVVNTNIGVEEKSVSNLFKKKTVKLFKDDDAEPEKTSSVSEISVPKVEQPKTIVQQPIPVVEKPKPTETKRKPLFTDNGDDEIKKVEEVKITPPKPKEMIKTTSMPVFGTEGKFKSQPQNLRQSESVWSEVSNRESKDDDFIESKQRMIMMQNMLKNKGPIRDQPDKKQPSIRESIDREDNNDHFIDNIMNQKAVVNKKKPKKKAFEGESIEINFRPSDSSMQTVIRETVFDQKISRLEEIIEVPEEKKDEPPPQKKKKLFDDDEEIITTKKKSEKKTFIFDD